MRRAWMLGLALATTGCQSFWGRTCCTTCSSPAPVMEERVETVSDSRESFGTVSPAPDIEVRGQREVHVQIPRPKVVVHQGQGCDDGCARNCQPAQPVAQACAPAQMMMGGYGVTQQLAVAQVPHPPARAALGIDWVRLPLPIPRLFAVPTASNVLVPQFAAAPIALQQVAVAPQPVAIAHQPVAVAPQAIAMPQAMLAAPQAVGCETPAHAIVAAPQQAFLQAPQMAMQPITYQAQPAQTIMVQPQQLAVMQQQIVPPTDVAVVNSGQLQGPRDSAVEELTRQLQTLEATIRDREQRYNLSQTAQPRCQPNVVVPGR